MDVIVKNDPIQGYNTKESSTVNGKPFLVEVVVVDPAFDPSTQTRTGPIDAYDGATATRTYTVEDIVFDMNDVKANGRYQIDYAAEMTRLRYITNGAGQAMVYQEKAIEAAAYAGAGYPADLTSYPFIQAEVNASGLSAQEAADAIIAIRTSWIAVSAQIEEVRLGAKVLVNAATTKAEVDTIIANTAAVLDGM